MLSRSTAMHAHIIITESGDYVADNQNLSPCSKTLILFYTSYKCICSFQLSLSPAITHISFNINENTDYVLIRQFICRRLLPARHISQHQAKDAYGDYF